MDESWYTVNEVAEHLKINPETIRVWLRHGRLRGVKIAGGRVGWRIPDSELQRVLTQGQASQAGEGQHE